MMASMFLTLIVFAAALISPAVARREKKIFFQHGTKFNTTLTCPLTSAGGGDSVQWFRKTPSGLEKLGSDVRYEIVLGARISTSVRVHCRVTGSKAKSKFTLVPIGAPPTVEDVEYEARPTAVTVQYMLSDSCAPSQFHSCDYVLIQVKTTSPVRVVAEVKANSSSSVYGTALLTGLLPRTSYTLQVQTYSSKLRQYSPVKDAQFPTPRNRISHVVPTGVTARALNETAMRVSWQPVGNVPAGVALGGYLVRYRVGMAMPSGRDDGQVRVPLNQTSVVIGGLALDMAYSVNVHTYIPDAVHGGEGHSAASQDVSVRLPVLHYTVAVVNATAIRLDWRDISPATATRLRIVVRPSGSDDPTVVVAPISKLSVTIGNLVPDTDYRVKPVAQLLDARGYKAVDKKETRNKSVRTLQLPVLTGLGIGMETDPIRRVVTVNLDPPRGNAATGPIVEVRASFKPELAPKVWRDYPVGRRRFDFPVPYGIAYEFALRVRYEHSGWSRPKSKVVQIASPQGGLISDPIVIVESASKVNVTWRLLRASSKVEGYNVSFQLQGEDRREYVYQTIGRTTNLTTIDNLLEAGKYNFCVQAYSRGHLSLRRCVETKLLTLSLAPKPLRVELHSLHDSSGVRVTWKAPAQSHAYVRYSYNIDYTPAIGKPDWKTVSLPPNITEYVMRSTDYRRGLLAAGVPYLVKMRAEYGRGQWKGTVGSNETKPYRTAFITSAECCKLPLAQENSPLGAVRQMVVTAHWLTKSLSQVTVRWYPPARHEGASDITAYKLYYKVADLPERSSLRAGDFAQLTAAYPLRELRFTVPRLLTDQIVAVTMNAVSREGDGRLSETAFVSIVGTLNEYTEHHFTLYPPTTPVSQATQTVPGLGVSSGNQGDSMLQAVLIAAGLALVLLVITVVAVVVIVRRVARPSPGKPPLRTSRQLADTLAQDGGGMSQAQLQHYKPVFSNAYYSSVGVGSGGGGGGGGGTSSVGMLTPASRSLQASRASLPFDVALQSELGQNTPSRILATTQYNQHPSATASAAAAAAATASSSAGATATGNMNTLHSTGDMGNSRVATESMLSTATVGVPSSSAASLNSIDNHRHPAVGTAAHRDESLATRSATTPPRAATPCLSCQRRKQRPSALASRHRRSSGKARDSSDVTSSSGAEAAALEEKNTTLTQQTSLNSFPGHDLGSPDLGSPDREPGAVRAQLQATAMGQHVASTTASRDRIALAEELQQQLEVDNRHLVAFSPASNSDFSSSAFDDSSPDFSPVKCSVGALRALSAEQNDSSVDRHRQDSHPHHTHQHRHRHHRLVGGERNDELGYTPRSSMLIEVRQHTDRSNRDSVPSTRHTQFTIADIAMQEEGEVSC